MTNEEFLAAIQGDKNSMPDGIYFGMDEDFYHALPMLNASGMKDLLISPMDFWARSWMNPDKEENETSVSESTQMTRTIGKAYHKRILEGRIAFYKRYCEEFVPPKDCLRSIDDMKKALLEAGITSKSAWKKPDYVMACRATIPQAPIYEVEKERYDKEHEGMEALDQRLIRKIEIAAAMIEKHPHLAKCFMGGLPEVTIIWTETHDFQGEKFQVRFKARFDYLKPTVIADLKTFANKMNKPIDMALYSAMAQGKYHIQACHYMHAGEVAVRFAQERRIHIMSPDIYVPDEWINLLASAEEQSFVFVFQQKGIAPLARGKWFRKGSMMTCAHVSIDKAIYLFLENRFKFGTDPWIDDEPITDFMDDGFPVYMTEI